MSMIINALPALEGFFSIGVLILLGWVLARIGLLGAQQRQMMSRIAFYVASPALMFMILVQADLTRVFTVSVVASYGAIIASGCVYISVSRLAYKHDMSGTVIGTFLSCYSNAGNLGIPVAAYALGDVTWMAPILLIQLAILQPVGLAMMDYQKAKTDQTSTSLGRFLSLPLRNPLTVAVLLGVVVNIIRQHVPWFWFPDFVAHPIDMMGAVAVPIMLLAFGVSLRVDPKPEKGPAQAESWLLVGIKIIIQPLAAWMIARLLGLDPMTIHAVTVVACLPPAQNIFVFASKYAVRMTFARDTIFRATGVSVVAVLIAATVLA